MLAGLLAGLLLGSAATLEPPRRDTVLRKPITAAQFIARLGETKDGRPVVRNMVIHPVRDGQNYVTFDAPAPDVVKPFGCYADAGILDQVKLRAARDPRIMFIYPWRESTAYILISRGGGGLFIATL